MWVRAYEYQTNMYPMEQMKLIIPEILHNHGIPFDLIAFLNTEKCNQSTYSPKLPERIEKRLISAESYVMDKYYA